MDKVFKALADPSRGVCCWTGCTRRTGRRWGSFAPPGHDPAGGDQAPQGAGGGQPRRGRPWRGREKLHYLNPVPIHEIAERWIGKFERARLARLAELKEQLEGETDG